jgi:Zn-dependent alcohol dehydrogenase
MANKKTMKAAVVEKFGEPLVVQEVPVPTPGPGRVLIEVFASGVCHTDLHAADGDWPIKPTPPFIPGHEGAGVVVALGPGVTHLKEGDRVGTAWLFSACGHCNYCLAGWERAGTLMSSRDELVFRTRTGTPLSSKNLYNRELAPACDRIKQLRISSHSCWHTHATTRVWTAERFQHCWKLPVRTVGTDA